ncbi:MAG: hypothetical protein NTY48_06740 [Candidatus Diapherotrites archaeon]|nr:hypothetical protein [Candidatus Diapherotrites archaeon]
MEQDLFGVAAFIKKSLRKDTNTFFLNFTFRGKFVSDLFFSKLQQVLPFSCKKNLIEVKYEDGLWFNSSRFGGYERNFMEIITRLKSKVTQNEKIFSTGIGGNARICYKNINLEAQKAIRGVFLGRVTQSSYLPLINGSKAADNLYYKRLHEERAVRFKSLATHFRGRTKKHGPPKKKA